MPPSIVIAGVYSHPMGEGLSPDATDEYVVLINTGERPIDMRGWSLTNLRRDRVHHYRYLFPRFLSNGENWALAPGGMILLYTGRGANGCTASAGEAPQYHLYQHRVQLIWTDPGDTACLHDLAGKVVSWCSLSVARRTA